MKSQRCIQSRGKHLRSSFLQKDPTDESLYLTIFAKSLDVWLVSEYTSKSNYFNSATSKHGCLRQINHYQINSGQKKIYWNNTYNSYYMPHISWFDWYQSHLYQTLCCKCILSMPYASILTLFMTSPFGDARMGGLSHIF